MSFPRSTEDYYRKFIELQEKLRKSEEERLRLEMKFNEMIQFTREEEEVHHRKLQSQYQSFLEEDIKRQERNDRIVKVLERIENRAALLAAKTERFQVFRKQYTTYLRSMTGDVHYHPVADNISLHSGPSKGSPTKSEVKFKASERLSFLPEREPMRYKLKNQNINLYNHPTIRRVLNGNGRSLNDDLESLRNCWKDRSPSQTHENAYGILEEDPSDSSDNQEINPISKDDEKMEKNIKWRPKLQLPRKNRFQFKRNRWHIPERRSVHTCPRRESKFSSTTSPSFQEIQADIPLNSEFPKYQDTKQDFGYNFASGMRPREDNFDFRLSSRSYPEKCTYSTSPARNYANDDLGYQLSNYPNLDVGHRINIEYTLYPKISDVSSHRSYHPSTSYLDQQRNTYSGHIPGGNRVSWYDHYLGRCPPKDTASKSYPKYDHDSRDFNNLYPKYTENTKDSNKYTNDCNTSKSKQDSILLNSEIRNSRHSMYSQKPKKVDFADDVPCEDNLENKIDDLPREIENVTQNDDDLKDDFDETEDQVLTEVLQEDALEIAKESSLAAEIAYEIPIPPTNLSNIDRDDIQEEEKKEKPLVLDDPIEEVNDDYYEEKHDSLEEIQKENPTQKDLKEEKTEVSGDVSQEHEEIDGDIKEESVAETPENEQHELENEKEIDEDEEILTRPDEEEVAGETVDILEKEEDRIVEEIVEKKQDEEGEASHLKEENLPSNSTNKDEKNEKENVVVENVVEDTNDKKVEEKVDLPENQDKESNQELITEYDNLEYQPSSEPVVQYDENEQPLQYTEYDNENIQYDEHGQPIVYDEGQYYPQYDENGQLIQQYDENGQPIVQYDENGQPIIQYDENGQPIVQYDENGQPLYQYDQYYQNEQFQEGQEQYVGEQDQYQEGEQPQYEESNVVYQEEQYQEDDQQNKTEGEVKEPQQSPDVDVEELKKGEAVEEGAAQNLVKKQDVEEVEVTEEKKMKVLDMLDTDSESTKQDTKVSNDSDFDFSNK